MPSANRFRCRLARAQAAWVEYGLFHSEASYYHWIQVFIHLGNALLVLGISWRLSKRWRTGFLGALFYAGLSVASEAVFWISDQAPFATFLALAAILFWIDHLQRRDKRPYFLAIGALILAFLSRESSAVVPAIFFLVDRMIVRDRASVPELIRRYSLVAVVFIVYLAIEYNLQIRGLFFSEGGYSFGEHVLSNYADYFSMLVFPWGLQRPYDHVALLVAGLSFVGIAILKRSAVLIFLALTVFLGVGPVVLTRLGVYARYLYLAAIPWAIFLALVFEAVRELWKSTWLRVVASILIACFVIWNGLKTEDMASRFSETARRERVPFRDIMRQHPTFPDNTRLFFVEPPYITPIPDIAGMFFLNYGRNVSVGGTYEDGAVYVSGRLRSERASLRDYATAYVYYFDETNKPIEVPVDPQAIVHATPELPRDIQASIRLEGFEITSLTLKKDQPLVLILYWRATERIDKDYTVFVHLVDSNGQTVAGVDNMPRDGKEKTSMWRLDQFTADAHVIPIPQEVTPGSDYRLEVGLYYLPTMERLGLIDSTRRTITDHLVIEPFNVIE